jgi:DNA-binding NtrC family response regulator
MALTVYILDDEEKMGQLIARGLERLGYRASAYSQPTEALEAIKALPPDVLLTDLKMPGMTGLDVLEHVKRSNPNIYVVLMTAYASAQSAIEALKKGAYDYLIKPFPTDELELLLKRVEERADLLAENTRLRQTLNETAKFDNIVANSDAMREVLEKVRRVAPSEATVLLRGESGTGKEVVATAIHAASRRADGPLIRVNCGAIPDTLLESELFGYKKGAFTGADRDKEGFFQAAHNGTLFLDEIGEITPALQVKLLRALQEGQVTPVGANDPLTVDVRIVAATNRDLESAIEEGDFRQDLYYRLNVVPIELSPLRVRRDDIIPLIDFFVQQLAAKGRQTIPFSREAIDMMARHTWPGNVRELQNAVEHASVMALGDRVTPDDLPPSVKDGKSHKPGVPGDALGSFEHLTLDEAERMLIEHALTVERGNQTHAARRLGITRRTLGYRLARHNLDADSYKKRDKSSEDSDAKAKPDKPTEKGPGLTTGAGLKRP